MDVMISDCSTGTSACDEFHALIRSVNPAASRALVLRLQLVFYYPQAFFSDHPWICSDTFSTF
jgi:hypothetical protein